MKKKKKKKKKSSTVGFEWHVKHTHTHTHSSPLATTAHSIASTKRRALWMRASVHPISSLAVPRPLARLKGQREEEGGNDPIERQIDSLLRHAALDCSVLTKSGSGLVAVLILSIVVVVVVVVVVFLAAPLWLCTRH